MEVTTKLLSPETYVRVFLNSYAYSLPGSRPLVSGRMRKKESWILNCHTSIGNRAGKFGRSGFSKLRRTDYSHREQRQKSPLIHRTRDPFWMSVQPPVSTSQIHSRSTADFSRRLDLFGSAGGVVACFTPYRCVSIRGTE
jgi:hypothetical protein